MYALPIWGTVRASKMKRLQVFENKFLRQVFNAEWFVRNTLLHREGQLETVKKLIQKAAASLFASAEIHRNRLVREAVDYTVYQTSLLR